MSRAKKVEKSFTGNREAWCIEIVKFLQEELAAMDTPILMKGEVPRTIKISIAPISKANTLGICHSSASSPDRNVNHIVISPLMASPFELAHTVLHEMLHAYDDCHSRHRGRWKKWADRFGIEAKGHTCNLRCRVLLERAIAHVGIPVEHATQVMIKNKKPPSIIKFMCPECGNFAYLSARVVVADEFHIMCEEHGIRMEQVDKKVDEPEDELEAA